MKQERKALLKAKIAATFAAIMELNALIVSDDYEWANNLGEGEEVTEEDEELASSLNNIGWNISDWGKEFNNGGE